MSYKVKPNYLYRNKYVRKYHESDPEPLDLSPNTNEDESPPSNTIEDKIETGKCELLLKPLFTFNQTLILF